MEKNKLVVLGLTMLTALALYMGQFPLGQSFGQQQPVGITAKYIEGPLPLTNPKANVWTQIQPFEATLGPQMSAFPWTHPEPSIRSIRVKAVNNGSWVSFHLAWNDATKDVDMRSDTFRDAVAVMLALAPGAGQCMGTPSANVTIAHWKADWQKDVEVAFTEIADLYPNFWSDWYVQAVGKPPYDLPSLYNQSRSKSFVGGWAAGNPLSNPYKVTPIETLVAEGFGTLTTYSFQSFVGWGNYSSGGWQVVVSRPLTTGHADPKWVSGDPLEVTFAAWDGSKGEIGAKKGVSVPIVLTLESPAVKAGAAIAIQPLEIWRISVVAGIFVLSISIIFLVAALERRGKAKL